MTLAPEHAPSRILLSSPDVGALEEELVVQAIRSGWIAPLGPMVDEFEDRLAARCGRAHAVALSSGTAALHLGLLQLGARPGAAVLVPTMTFAATANAVVYTGAQPVFVDCDPATGNIDPALVEELVRDLRRDGVHVAAAVPVDLFGRCADYETLLPVLARSDVPVLVDAAESLGSLHAGRPAGSFGDLAVVSFNGNKVMTTSGGGALFTDDAAVADRARYLSTQARRPAAHYEHTEIGFNYRLSNLLAALGVAQLQRLDEMVSRRRGLRRMYLHVFHGAPGVQVFQADTTETDNCWLSGVVVDPTVAGWTVDELTSHLADAGIESRPMWKPMHRQPVFAGHRSSVTGAADRLFATGLMLPSGSAMTTDDVSRVREEIEDFLRIRR